MRSGTFEESLRRQSVAFSKRRHFLRRKTTTKNHQLTTFSPQKTIQKMLQKTLTPL
jgi:hypothetical protein